MTFDEARTRKNYAKPISRIKDGYMVLVVPEDEQDFNSYRTLLYRQFPAIEDSDAVQFSSDGRFTLRAFVADEGHIESSECEITVDF